MLGTARMGNQQSAAQLSLRTARQWLSKPIIGKTIAVGLTLSLFHLDLAPALEAKRVLEPIAPKKVELPALPKPSLFAMLGHWIEQITVQPTEQPPLPPAPGFAPTWGASASVYGGSANLGNGNLTLQLPLIGWADGVSFALYFNSQANPSQPSPIAPKWTHNGKTTQTAAMWSILTMAQAIRRRLALYGNWNTRRVMGVY